MRWRREKETVELLDQAERTREKLISTADELERFVVALNLRLEQERQARRGHREGE